MVVVYTLSNCNDYFSSVIQEICCGRAFYKVNDLLIITGKQDARHKKMGY